jgi:hypothetical protein
MDKSEGWFLTEKDGNFIWFSEAEVNDDEFDTKDVVFRCFYGRERGPEVKNG